LKSKRLTIGILSLKVILQEHLAIVPGGTKGRHFSYFFYPKNEGGPLEPHITDERTGKKLLRGRFWVSELESFFHDWEKEQHRQWSAAVKLSRLEELEAEGWIVFPPDPSKIEQLFGQLKSRRGYRLTEELIRRLPETLGEPVPPTSLVDRTDAKQGVLFGAQLEREGTWETAQLIWLPAGPSGEGWYLLPSNWLDPDAVKKFIRTRVPRSFWVWLRQALKLLGLGDPAAIDRLLEEGAPEQV